MAQIDLEDVLEFIFSSSQNTRQQGAVFEKATVYYLKNDSNEYLGDPRHNVDLVRRMVRVSLEANEIVANLPALDELSQPVCFPFAWKAGE